MNLNSLLASLSADEIPEWISRLLDTASCGIVIADARQHDLPLVYVNRTFEQLTGYQAREVLGRNCRFLLGQDREQPELQALRQALAEGQEVKVVLRNYRRDGSLFWNELQLAPLLDAGGKLTHFVGTQTDITAYRQALQDVEQQQRHFALCLEAIPFGVLLMDAQGRISYANQAAAQLTGKSFVPGSHIADLATYCQVTRTDSGEPYDMDGMPIMRALRGQQATSTNMTISRDGELVPLFVSASPIFDQQGAISHAVAIFADISEIRAQQLKLAESEARHKALLNSAVDAIITIDSGGIIQSVNPATERIFGYGPEELIGQNVKLLMPEPHRSHHDRYLQHYLTTGQARVIGIGRETMAVRKDGYQFPIELTVTEVKLTKGIVFKGIVRDISRRKAAEQRAASTLEELRKSERDLISLLNQFRVGSLILDTDLRVSFVSESCERLLGVDRASLLHQHWERALPCPPQEKVQLQHMLSLPLAERHRLTLHWRDALDQERWLECDVRDDPRDPGRRIVLLYDVTEIHALRQSIEQRHHGRLLGSSGPMQQLYRLIEDVARGNWTVLIEGETGVGKELVAHSIHAASPYRDGPFIAVNCAGLSETLLASQLFGHRKGAFTGAVADQEGFFEAAHGGTLFLDEIGDLPQGMQASLLRVLQEKEIIRVGETRPRKVDVRILAATHKDLVAEVAAGRFRQDLLYRLRIARLYVPALREHKEDLPLLEMAFLRECGKQADKAPTSFSPEALRVLADYAWPGNVRELRACVDYAVMHCHGERIQREDLPPEIGLAAPMAAATLSATDVDPTPLPAGDDRSRIAAALRQTGGNRLKAAKLLGISRATFYRRLSELDITPDP